MLILRDFGKSRRVILRLLVTICFVAGIFFSENAFLFAQGEETEEVKETGVEDGAKDGEEGAMKVDGKETEDVGRDNEEAVVEDGGKTESQQLADGVDSAEEEYIGSEGLVTDGTSQEEIGDSSSQNVVAEDQISQQTGEPEEGAEGGENEWQPGAVIINEIAWMGTLNSSNDEWIELRNTKKEDVNLDGWILKADDGVPEIDLSGTVSAEGYFLLERTDDETVPNVDADQIYTGALGNDGEYLRLVKDDGEDSDRVDCSDGWKAGNNTTKQTMELGTDGKWKDSAGSGGTPKGEASGQQPVEDEPALDWKVYINELVPDPVGTDTDFEWVEIFNDEEAYVDLENWMLVDASGKAFTFGAEVLCAKCFRTIPYSESKIVLNNTGDSLSLFDIQGNLVGNVAYREDVGEGFSFARKSEGGYGTTPILTPGKENEFPIKKDYPKNIFINEFFPNPEGIDQDKEMVELFNEGAEAVPMENWTIEGISKIGSAKRFVILDGEILPNGFFVAQIKKSEENRSFAIGNSDYGLRLLDPNGDVVDSVSYAGSAGSGLSYNKTNDGDWKWSRFLTPGKENRINKPPTIKIKKPAKIYKDLYAELDASKTKDGDKDKLKFRWDFGDGHRSYLKETRHKYEKKGKYTVQLQVDDGSEKVTKIFKIEVESFPKYALGIVGLVPNPKGKDTGNEVVVIGNYEKKKIDLKGYYLATGASRKKMTRHPVYDSFVLGAGEFEEMFNGELCKFSLRNSSGFVALMYPNGKIADIVQYQKEKISDDEIYKLVDGRWEWIGGVESETEEVAVWKEVEVFGERISIFDPTIEELEGRCVCLRTMQIKNLLYSWENFLEFLKLPA